MRFNVISEAGHGLGLAMRLQSEGHGVNFHSIPNTEIGKGIVTHGQDTSADITVVDSETFGKEADDQKRMGYRVLGSSHWSQMIEDNKEYANNIIRLAGWNTNEITDGVNLYITSWFNGTNFISTYASIVYRRFMSGGRGPDVKFTGMLSTFSQPTDIIKKEFLVPLEPILKRVSHRGAFHIHAVLSGDRYSVKEISASFNSPLSLPLFNNTNLSMSQILLKLLDENSKNIPINYQWAAGVLLTVPPYPYQIHADQLPIRGIQPVNLKHLWLIDVKKEGHSWETAGVNGKIGYVLASGNTLFEAARRVYRTISNINCQDMQFRNDVGKDVNALITPLIDYKWIKAN